MEYIVSASEMRRYDSNTIEKIGIPACVLMERAALAALAAVEERCAGRLRGIHVLIMSGTGNNGGDGLALARLLAEKGSRVEVWRVGERQKASDQWLRQEKILENYPVKVTDVPGRQDYHVLVDALFGVGLSREVTGIYAEAIGLFNRLEGWKLALDLPSGIDADTGRLLGTGVRADMTVAFGFRKRGLVLYPGCGFAGEVRTAHIGISGLSFFGREPEMFAYDEDTAALMPDRDEAGNKGTFGKVLLAAGSVGMAGAAVLAAKAAFRAGAGMVKVVSCAENRAILQQAVPEALLGSPENLAEEMAWADVAAVGPGLGKGEAAERCLTEIVEEGSLPLLVDADGLNLLAQRSKLRRLLEAQGLKGRQIVLTPHVGELARLTGKPLMFCKENLAAVGTELAAAYHGVVAAKDARTFTCGDGRICVNLSGNSGMATAGSGDVLAGVIAAFMAQGMGTFRAASAGVCVHGRAGDYAAAQRGKHACMAMDIAEAVGRFPG